MTQNQIGAVAATGTIWMNTGNSTGISFLYTTSYKELSSLGTNFTLMSNAPYFTMTTDGRLKYTGKNTLNFVSNAVMLGSDTGNRAIAIGKNGTIITGSDCYNDRNTFICPNVLVSLSTNDYLSVFAKRSTSSTSAIYQIILTAEALIS